MDSQDDLKQKAARQAVDFVDSGMVLGLGTGSTTSFAVVRIGELLRHKKLKDVVGVPTSLRTEELAKRSGIPLTTLDDHPWIDLTIDGADEIDPHLNLIKGGGGALLREKIVAQASKRNIIVVDESKLSDTLGTTWALPIEVIPFARRTEEEFLKALGASITLRLDQNGQPYQTDQNNWILDARFTPLPDPFALARQLDQRAGIVEHGLFLDIATDAIVAAADNIHHLQRSPKGPAPDPA